MDGSSKATGRELDGVVVVRFDGRWWLTQTHSATAVALTLEQLIERLQSLSEPDRATDEDLGAVVDPPSRGELVGQAFSGRPCRSGLVVSTHRSGKVMLSVEDLIAIDSEHSAHQNQPVSSQSNTGGTGAEEPQTSEFVGGSPSQARSKIGAESAADLRRSDERIPVYFPFPEDVGPLLSLGMLSASARSWEGGRLTDEFEIRRPESAGSVLAALTSHRKPGILVLSDYVFTLTANIETARAAKRLNPNLVVLHGGPSSPKYDKDIEEFFTRFGDVADVLARGEGEELFCELLEALAVSGVNRDAVGDLGAISGIAFQDPKTSGVCRTPDRQRSSDINSFPSPYLSGEFDELSPEVWVDPPFFETNRGCPYGCTFCDWGSATNSRIRRFDLQRVVGEFRWAVERGQDILMLCDSNFGILKRDIEIAKEIGKLKAEFGRPNYVMVTPSKNRINHLLAAFEILFEAGISPIASISLQTTDDVTLGVVKRQNISIDGYLELAAFLRRRGHALVGDLILGLPAQTYDSYKSDLQFMLDHEITPRTFPLRMLPNSPMNDPQYRKNHKVSVNPLSIISSTQTMSEEDRSRMLMLHSAEIIFERLGLLRHIMRYLQWDLDLPAMDVIETILDVATGHPERYPNLSWVCQNFDRFPIAPDGWQAFYSEVERFLVDEFAVQECSPLRTVMQVQHLLMPSFGRSFPAVEHLDHDYVAYYASAVRHLYLTGSAGGPARPLAEYGSGSFTVAGDPFDLCVNGLRFEGDSRKADLQGDFHVGARASNELDSALIRRLPSLTGFESQSTQGFVQILDLPDNGRIPTLGGAD